MIYRFIRPRVAIVINNLTRMRKGYICAAGINLKSFNHVRPVLSLEQLSANLLTRHGGPFDIGNVVFLGRPSHRPNPPHVEDYLVRQRKIRQKGIIESGTFWELLIKVSKSNLSEIFGAEFTHIRRALYGTEKGKGLASLGCLYLRNKPMLTIEHRREKSPLIRLKFRNEDFFINAAVNDLRLYNDDHFTPNLTIVEKVKQQIEKSTDIILSIGLTRAWASSSDTEEIHWLQVNNLHFKEEPLWQLG